METALRIETAWIFRQRYAVPGEHRAGVISWNRNGKHYASISYEADMLDEADATLSLSYTRNGERVEQRIRFTSTRPQYGGRRWWFLCPYHFDRCAKLYLPSGGDRFAGREAWRLGYKSQRCEHSDRPFEKLFRLQRKLGSDEGWQAGIRRPKGMRHATFERHFARYLELEEECDAAADKRLLAAAARLGILPDRL